MSTSPGNHHQHQHGELTFSYITPIASDKARHPKWKSSEIPIRLQRASPSSILDRQWLRKALGSSPAISKAFLITKSCPLILRIFLDTEFFPFKLCIHTKKPFLDFRFFGGETLHSVLGLFSSFRLGFFLSSSLYCERAGACCVCFFLFSRPLGIFFNNIFRVWRQERKNHWHGRRKLMNHGGGSQRVRNRELSRERMETISGGIPEITR